MIQFVFHPSTPNVSTCVFLRKIEAMKQTLLRFIFLVALAAAGHPAWAQPKVSWGILETTTLRKVTDLSSGYEFLRPKFSLDVLSLDGKRVKISGYVIPLDLEGREYALSANPFASCFFCGGGSPTSVLTLVLLPGQRKFSTDEWVQFEGVFRLNADPHSLMYALEQAIELK